MYSSCHLGVRAENVGNVDFVFGIHHYISLHSEERNYPGFNKENVKSKLVF